MRVFLLCLYFTLDVANEVKPNSWFSPTQTPPPQPALSRSQSVKLPDQQNPPSLTSLGRTQSSLPSAQGTLPPPTPPPPPPGQGTRWDRKTPVDPSTTYDSLPSDLKHMADQIEQADKIYKDPTKALQARCRALITVHRNLVPMLIAYNIGRPFKILGPAGEEAEVKVQTGFYVSRYHSVWQQIFKCRLGKAATLMSSDNPRPVLPLWYK